MESSVFSNYCTVAASSSNQDSPYKPLTTIHYTSSIFSSFTIPQTTVSSIKLKNPLFKSQFFEKMVPCNVITPLDCFWDGAKIHGPDNALVKELR